MVISRLLLICAGVVTMLVLIEVIFRLFAPAFPASLRLAIREVRPTPFSPMPAPQARTLRYDQHFGFVNRIDKEGSLHSATPTFAFHVTTINWLDPNSNLGFRVPSADWTPPWPIDAVVVGDSFTFCLTDYDDCWVGRLATDYGLHVVNEGSGGSGSISHARIYDTFGKPYEPRFVIWQWYSNDVRNDYDMSTFPDGVDPGYFTFPPKDPFLATPLGRWLYENSVIVHYSIELRNEQQFIEANPQLKDPYTIRDGDVTLIYGRSEALDLTDLQIPENQQGWELGEQAILDTKMSLDSSGTPLVIVLIPTKEEVYQQWTLPVLGQDWLDRVSASRLKMLELCADHAIRCIDVTAALQEHADNKELLYWPGDMHLNPAGNKIVSDTLYAYLLEEGLVSSK
jgi:hypothetical protein